jgi:hypothetical protein
MVAVSINEDIEEAQKRLRTYYGYAESFVTAARQAYNTDDDATLIRRLLHSQKQLPRYKKTRGGGEIVPALQSEFRHALARSLFTIEAMRRLPVDSEAGLVHGANLWLPVQAYYSVHGAGQACLISLSGTAPRDHRGFRAAFADIAPFLFPWPLSIICTGGPEKEKFELGGGATIDIGEVIGTSNLSSISGANAEVLIAKCLTTSRRRALEDIYEEKRRRERKPSRSRRNLNRQEKEKTCADLHGTTVADFLYRMRIRSNYDDPSMYIFAYDDMDEAASHYKNLCLLSEMVAACAEGIICRRLGMEKLIAIHRKLRLRRFDSWHERPALPV